MEGPSLVIISEELLVFKDKTVIDLSGNTKIDKERMCNQKVLDIFSWGKHLVIQFETFAIRVHFLMFGSYRINTRRDGMTPRLSLQFENASPERSERGEINFYNCSIKFIEEKNAKKCYEWEIDIMSSKWSKEKVLEKVLEQPDEQIADILMDQDIFAGVGNIIKNEVLFRVKIHPEALVKNLARKQIEDVVAEARIYSLQFYEWKKEFTLKKHWQIFRKKVCPVCSTPVTRKPTGKRKRLSHFCFHCQMPPLTHT
jgi:endonuclease VIII